LALCLSQPGFKLILLRLSVPSPAEFPQSNLVFFNLVAGVPARPAIFWVVFFGRLATSAPLQVFSPALPLKLVGTLHDV
jgi:hypothetical protein